MKTVTHTYVVIVSYDVQSFVEGHNADTFTVEARTSHDAIIAAMSLSDYGRVLQSIEILSVD